MIDYRPTELDLWRRENRDNQRFDYCGYQEVVNLLGGDRLSPAYREQPRSACDNLGMYGFKYWMEHATFSVVRDEWMYPTFSGVYAVACVYPEVREDGLTVGALHLLYIGSAKNIAERLKDKDHWYNRALDRIGAGVVMLYVLPTTDYRLYEKSLIRTLRPLFNIHHNGRS